MFAGVGGSVGEAVGVDGESDCEGMSVGESVARAVGCSVVSAVGCSVG